MNLLYCNRKVVFFVNEQISTINEYWSWLENSFISNLRAQEWYNNDPPRNLSGFINDKSNRLIGWSIMEQTRIAKDKCSYQPGWMNETSEISNSSIDQAFQYRINEELDDSGGYIYEFRGRLSDLQSNLSKLHQLGWIDNKTDVVTIQMSLYNPNSQLFTSITLLTQFLSTGGILPQALFQPFDFYFNLTSIFQLVCAIFFIILIIYFMFNEIESFFRLKSNYFRQFWSYIEVGIIICSWTSVGIYVWKYKEGKRIGNWFKESNGYVYINFQSAAYINDLLTYFLGFCCFFGTIKLIRCCRFNQRSLSFIRTIEHASKDLLSFAMMFSIIFMAFLTLFYLLFVSKLLSCSNLLQTAEMLFEMAVLKYNVHGFIEASPFLGPFTFSLFIFIVVFVCLSMFISIIIDSSRHVRRNINDDDEEIFSLMWNKFCHWTGLIKWSICLSLIGYLFRSEEIK